MMLCASSGCWPQHHASSELPEIVALSDRVLVMHEGRVCRVLDKAEISQENIMGAVFAG